MFHLANRRLGVNQWIRVWQRHYTVCRLGQRAKWATKAHRSWKEQTCPVRIANVSRRYVLIRSRSSTHIMNSCARRLRYLGEPPAAPVKSVRTSSRDSDRESRVRLLDSWYCASGLHDQVNEGTGLIKRYPQGVP